MFLNSIAHYQHNNWNEKNNEKYFFLYTEKIFSKILELKKNYNSFLIFNGFSQKKIKEEYLIRPKNPEKFISNFIEFKKLEQDMTNGGFIFFNDDGQLDIGAKILENLYFKNKKIFLIKKVSRNSIYYKVNLKSFKKLGLVDLKNQTNLNKYLFENIKNISIKNKSKIDISNYFVNQTKFLKTTGVHVPEGVILYENLNSFKKLNRIENHRIFSYIKSHFLKK